MAKKKKAVKTKKTVKKAGKKAVKKSVKKTKAAGKKQASGKGSTKLRKGPGTVKVKKKAAAKKRSPLLDAVIKGMEEKKGKRIVLIDLENIPNRVADYFVICEAESRTQVNALADSVEEAAKTITGASPYHSEGFENSEWVLIDYITVVAHIFQPSVRWQYNLEGLWADAEITHISRD